MMTGQTRTGAAGQALASPRQDPTAAPPVPAGAEAATKTPAGIPSTPSGTGPGTGPARTTAGAFSAPADSARDAPRAAAQGSAPRDGAADGTQGPAETAESAKGPSDPAEAARAQAYGLLAALLARPPEAGLLDRLGALAATPDASTPWGRATGALARAAAEAEAGAVAREYGRLFIGLQRGELLPYASYYRTGFLHDRPLMKLRADMARLGVARAEGLSEPEDHIAGILDMMSGLITGRFGAPAPPQEQAAFFQAHLAPWARHFFTDLHAATEARFYRPVGALGALLMEIEHDAIALTD